MEKERKKDWQIRLATMSIFLLGFLAGGLALNAYHVWFNSAAPVSRQERFERIFNQLDLSEQQRSDVQKIVGETREELQKLREGSEPRVREIRNRADVRMQQVLNPEQWQKFQKMKEEMTSRKETR
jgi:Spy/CpxP family protein refolding chaperone